jgi:flagellin FlaB
MTARRSLRPRDRAEVGVGTLIVFIAMVLVAAVAAAVLIGTTGSLQGRAQATGKEAMQEVSSNLKVIGIHGLRNSSTSDVANLDLTVSLSAGATPMDLTRLIVRYSDGTHVANYAYGSPGFSTSWIRGANNSAVLFNGDLVQIQIALGSLLPPRQPVSLALIPESGALAMADFTTPSTYVADTTVTLR